MSVIYDHKKVKQIKLSTGEEIICEIIEEDDADIIVRNAISINLGTLENGERTWTFRYFMCYQDDPERFILIKLDKVVAVANPMTVLVAQYEGALAEMVHAESGHMHEKPEYLEDEYHAYDKTIDSLQGDSDSSNIVPLFH
jgi:hypothetical protein